MSALKEVTFWKRREDRPEEVEKMAEFFSEHGWTYVEEWMDAWEDEDGEHEGWWCYSLVYEEMVGEQLHMWHMRPVQPTPYVEAWEHALELGRMGWENYKESLA